MKKILAFLFITVMLVTAVSCSSGIDPAVDGEEAATNTAAPSTTLEIVQKGKSDYTIVHDGTEDAKNFADQISGYIRLKFGPKLEIESAEDADGRYEIVIGSVEGGEELDSPYDFSLAVKEDRLYLNATGGAAYRYFLEYLKREVLVRGTSADLTLTPENSMRYTKSSLANSTFVDYLREGNKALDPDVFFDAGVFKHEKTSLLYRIYIPSTYSAEKKYPIFVHLHGAGIRGNDNKRPLSFVKKLFQEESYALDECIVIVPQCPEGEKWVDITWADGSYDLEKVSESNEFEALVALIESTVETFSVDENRIWAAGFSMGGYGTWNLLMNHPDLFCAGVPMCGAASPAHAEALLNTPVWAIHGVKDPTVPVSGSREMVEAIRALGGKNVKYTELPDHEHDVWNYTYDSDEIFAWLFSQSKAS